MKYKLYGKGTHLKTKIWWEALWLFESFEVLSYPMKQLTFSETFTATNSKNFFGLWFSLLHNSVSCIVFSLVLLPIHRMAAHAYMLDLAQKWQEIRGCNKFPPKLEVFFSLVF